MIKRAEEFVDKASVRTAFRIVEMITCIHIIANTWRAFLN